MSIRTVKCECGSTDIEEVKRRRKLHENGRSETRYGLCNECGFGVVWESLIVPKGAY